MKTFTVRHNGNTVKSFSSMKDAQQFMVKFVEFQNMAVKQLEYIDEAVLKSDMAESKQVIKRIMEMR